MIKRNYETLLKQLIEENLTQPQIAEKLNKSVSQIKRLLKKYGLKTQHYCDHNPNATHRKCRYCHIVKEITCFPLVGKNQEYRRWKCCDCYTKMKTCRKQDISNFVKDIKQKCVCSCCGNNDFRVIDFHHKKDKNFNVADAAKRGYSKETILKEIEKCVPMCANCHRIYTYEERNK